RVLHGYLLSLMQTMTGGDSHRCCAGARHRGERVTGDERVSVLYSGYEGPACESTLRRKNFCGGFVAAWRRRGGGGGGRGSRKRTPADGSARATRIRQRLNSASRLTGSTAVRSSAGWDPLNEPAWCPVPCPGARQVSATRSRVRSRMRPIVSYRPDRFRS